MQFYDRVSDTTTTTGTGTITLTGSAPTGYRSFAAACTTGNIVNYTIFDTAGNWEVGQGTVTVSVGVATLTRTAQSSSNSNAAVSFGSGTKSVLLSLAASSIFVPSGPAPNAPTIGTATLGNAQVTVTWSAPASGQAPSGYTLQRATDSGFTANVVNTDVGNVLTSTPTGLTNTQIYYFRVSGYYNGASGSWSGSVSATPSAYRIHDKFDVSNQTNNGRTPDTADVPGGTWSNTVGTASVVSNTLQGTTFSSFTARTVIQNSQRAATVEATVSHGNGGGVRQGVVLIFRYADADNFFYAQTLYLSNGDPANYIYLGKAVAGVFTQIGSAAATIAHSTNYTMTASDDGNNVSASINGATASASSTDLASNTMVGIAIQSFDSTNYATKADEFKVT